MFTVVSVDGTSWKKITSVLQFIFFNVIVHLVGILFCEQDAAKGYLKLLVVTAAAGDETSGSMSQRCLTLVFFVYHTCYENAFPFITFDYPLFMKHFFYHSTSFSARDLSLILDAILKTKSRMVLVDIINKNGKCSPFVTILNHRFVWCEKLVFFIYVVSS